MISIQGKGVSGGVACGPLFFLRRADGCPEKTVVLDVAAEKQRAEVAIAASVEQLEQLAEQCRRSAGEETAMVFETHAMLAEDEDFLAGIFSRLKAERCNAAWAVYDAGHELATFNISLFNPSKLSIILAFLALCPDIPTAPEMPKGKK